MNLYAFSREIVREGYNIPACGCKKFWLVPAGSKHPVSL